MLTKKIPETTEEKKTTPRSTKKNQSSTLKSNTPTLAASKEKAQSKEKVQEKKGTTSRVIIKYDVGFNNHLFIRGKGANLSWQKGIQLKNTSADEWLWETDLPLGNLEFKVLINDLHYEDGDNHQLKQGQIINYTPRFT